MVTADAPPNAAARVLLCPVIRVHKWHTCLVVLWIFIREDARPVACELQGREEVCPSSPVSLGVLDHVERATGVSPCVGRRVPIHEKYCAMYVTCSFTGCVDTFYSILV
jgi:hypothetical protein